MGTKNNVGNILRSYTLFLGANYEVISQAQFPQELWHLQPSPQFVGTPQFSVLSEIQANEVIEWQR